MESSSRRSASGPVLGFSRTGGGGKYCSSTPLLPPSSNSTSKSSSGFSSGFTSGFAATASSTFTSSSSSVRSNGGFFRSTSPTRVKMSRSNSSSQSQSVSFSITDRSISPSRSISASSRERVVKRQTPPQKRTCMCSPTNHPGSFRCSLHKNQNNNNQADSYTSNRLNARRSAMANSLVRIGTVEGDWVKRALAALIRPSSHHQRRRAAFQPRPSRLCVMSKAEEVL